MCRSQYARTSSTVATPDNIARRASRSGTARLAHLRRARRRRRHIRPDDRLRRGRSAARRSRSSSATISAAAAPSITCGRSTAACATCSTSTCARARESVRERRTLARIAPHALTPLPFALPLYRSVTRGRLAMRAGFLLDRIVAAGRNRDVVPALRLPAGRVVSRQHAIEQFPGLRRRGLTGAAVWHDYVTPEADRLTFSWALAAAAHGAVLANHVEALSVAKEGRRVSGVSCVDQALGPDIRGRGQDGGECDGRRGRSPARLGRPLDRPPDAQGDEPGHEARRRRCRARRTLGVGPQPVPGPVAAPGAVRNLGVLAGVPPGPGVADGGGGRLVHCGVERSVSGARSEAVRRGAGASRGGAGRRDIQAASRSKGISRFATMPATASRGCSRWWGPSTPRHAPLPSRSWIAC